MTPDSLDDASLMRRLGDGDQGALRLAYDRYGALVHTIALRRLGDHHDAQDVTQQVFIALWDARATLAEQRGSLPGWLTTVTQRRCVDAHRTSGRERRRVDAVIAHEPSRQDSSRLDPGENIGRLVVADALARLGDPRAEIVRRAVVDDQQPARIAEELGLPLGTVKSHLRRGLLTLRSRLQEVNTP